MKIWICFWTYAPLHQWHLDVIMIAKKENDKCIVFVSRYDGDRWDKYGLTLSKRYRLVKKFFENDESILVFSINDTALWLDNSWSDDNRKIRMSNAYAKLYEQQLYGEITWYVSEESYKDSIEFRK